MDIREAPKIIILNTYSQEQDNKSNFRTNRCFYINTSFNIEKSFPTYVKL